MAITPGSISVIVTDDFKPLAYGVFVDRLEKKLDTVHGRFNHMALGVGGEAGELIDAIKRYTIYNKPLNRENVVEEIGDLFWYVQGIMNLCGITMDEIMQSNYEKLKKRYGESYSDEKAIARADKAGE